MADREKALAALKAIVEAIIEAVNAAGPMGAPGGHIYAALMQYMTLDQFTRVMDGLVAAGKLRRSGLCYFPAEGQ